MRCDRNVRRGGGGGGGGGAKTGQDAVPYGTKVIMIKIRDVPAKTGQLATLGSYRQQGYRRRPFFEPPEQSYVNVNNLSNLCQQTCINQSHAIVLITRRILLAARMCVTRENKMSNLCQQTCINQRQLYHYRRSLLAAHILCLLRFQMFITT